MKNKTASVQIYGIMLGLTIIILAMALAPAGKQIIGSTMNVTTGDAIGMDCGNESISSFVKAPCIIMDFSLFYFFGGLIFLGGTIMVGRLVFS